jgi:protein O-GlcNAc transferase
MNAATGPFYEAMALHRAGHLPEAEAAYRDILHGEPGHFGALHHLGALRAGLGANEEAAELLGQAAAIDPAATIVHFQRACVLSELGRLDEALVSYDTALAQKSDLAPFHSGRGSVLHALRRYEEAVASYGRALALKPNDPLTLANRAGALQSLGRIEQALDDYGKALALSPDDARTRLARGLLLLRQDQPELAAADLERAAQRTPSDAEIWLQLGNALGNCNSHEQAAAAYSKAIALKADNAEAYAYRGAALGALRRLDEALADCDRAIALKPEFAAAYYNRSNVLHEMGRSEEALADCDKALALAPVLVDAAGASFAIAAMACDWSRSEDAAQDLVRRARDGQYVPPFLLLYASSDPGVHLLAARQFAGAAKRAARPLPVQQKLRIAYLSPDFRDHPVAHQSAELFERHDRTRFELFGICLSRGEESPVRQRLRKAFDRFVEAGTRSDPDLAALLVELGIGIAVDLAGYTSKGRSKALAWRPAPLAVNFLGYPGTLGAPYVDYIVADETVIPPALEGFYAEKVVRLPGCFLPRDTRGAEVCPPPSRRDAGLPENGLVFCAFNNAYKISPQVFGIWMRLLSAVEGSVLWLNTQDEKTRTNLRREAAARNVAPQRLVFAERVAGREQHLARIALADMFLDTMPYGAHSTANDMLWSGVPVVTCLGHSFAARVAASMLKVSGLEELVAQDAQDYEKLALALARTPAHIVSIRGRLAAGRSSNPLFDTAGLCRHLETAYQTMWNRHQEGQKPESFTVTS